MMRGFCSWIFLVAVTLAVVFVRTFDHEWEDE